MSPSSRVTLCVPLGPLSFSRVTLSSLESLSLTSSPLMARPQGPPLSLTPNFSWVDQAPVKPNCFNSLTQSKRDRLFIGRAHTKSEHQHPTNIPTNTPPTPHQHRRGTPRNIKCQPPPVPPTPHNPRQHPDQTRNPSPPARPNVTPANPNLRPVTPCPAGDTRLNSPAVSTTNTNGVAPQSPGLASAPTLGNPSTNIHHQP